jgi:hypothetical protein
LVRLVVWRQLWKQAEGGYYATLRHPALYDYFEASVSTGKGRGHIGIGICALLLFMNITLMYAYWHQFIPLDGANQETIKELPKKLWN